MQKRIKLSDRLLPSYTKAEEITNMVTHIVGGALAIWVFLSCLFKAIRNGNAIDIVGVIIYGSTMITVYAVSSVYHGLLPGTPKKVMQIIDHCAIYFLIAGTYTPIMLSAFIPRYPLIGWCILAAQWLLVGLAVTLTAIDLHKFKVFSMICYIGMGWMIILFLRQTITVMSFQGFALLLTGGVVYSIGAVLFGIGSKLKWMHSVFHVFVIVGSIFQYLAIYIYVQ